MSNGHSRLFAPLMPVLLLTLAACGPSEESASPSTGVEERRPVSSSAFVTAEVETIHAAFEYPGVVEAIQTAATRAQVSGTITAIHFTPGQTVEEGNLLVEFDAADYEVAMDITKASLSTAQAALREAEAAFKRAEALMPDAISGEEFEHIQAQRDIAIASVESVEAQVRKAELDLERTRIRAPFTGKISKSNYAVGEYVNTQSPTQPQPLFELSQVDPIYVRSNVSLGLYNSAVLLRQRLAEAGEPIPEMLLRLELAGGQIYPHDGRFVDWDSSSNASMGTITGRIEIANPDSLLLPGQNVLVRGERIEELERIVVPQKAVSLDQQGHYVMIIDDDDVVRRRNVEVGLHVRERWAILEGLEDGDRVLVEGLQVLREGTALDIQAQP